MIFTTIVKHNGKLYPAGANVPVEEAPKEGQVNVDELIDNSSEAASDAVEKSAEEVDKPTKSKSKSKK